jgi:predicted GNAT family acetyltransferase
MWSALTTRQAHLALGDPKLAVRLDPAFGLFAAAADNHPASQAALAALIPEDGLVGLVELQAAEPPPGAVVRSAAVCVQMTADQVTSAPPPPFEVVELGDADAAEMLALATLTKPGPFVARTHQLGRFIGVKVDGVLAAMAGERMRPMGASGGFTEASGVCTHPDHRGRGYAAALLRQVTARILDSGDHAYLHSYADNAVAIGLYESLGYRIRARVIYSLIARA